MARNNAYHERSNPLLTVLYVIVALALIAALVYMYMNYREKRAEYLELVREVSRTETAMELSARGSASEDEAEATAEPTEATEATVEPADEATATPEPVVETPEPAVFEAAPEATEFVVSLPSPEPTETIGFPEDELLESADEVVF